MQNVGRTDECNDYTDKAIAQIPFPCSYYNMTRSPLRPTKVFVISSTTDRLSSLASEDRFEQYQVSGSNFKRRAVSPSVSLTGSPVLSGISSPPANFMMYGTSPTNTSANAAARVQQRTNQPPSHRFNLHDASGGLSKMSLSEE
ncbi:hypothetical protein INT44_002987 [Umbelopsis vinacea]|uniref:Uncharacterized protein n=1 Tax=Umbelopsis vinacea TaxID=44442 RepID=A0A8H7Q6M1_9FUNG|nr:hypothetical protein INT44_002987 [Umbelopsis vinacea]